MQAGTIDSKSQNEDSIMDQFSAIKQQFDKMHSESRMEPHWTYEKRIKLLNQLELMQKENEAEIIKAIDADFGGKEGGRGLQWCRLSEIFLPLSMIKHAKENLKAWMQDEEVSPGFPFNLMGRSYCMFQPLGVVLCVAPWNFPFFLINAPLGDILGAGNRVMLKPSEGTPQSSALLSQLVPKYFPGGEVVVAEGDYKVSQYLTSLPFDHILFTGGGSIGKKVLKSAAENLVPVTLELGGKCPALVSPDFSIKEAANQIIDSKVGNAGQQCNGVDYVFVPRGKANEFAEKCADRVRERWGETGLENNPGYCSIINSSHYNRIKGLVADAKNRKAKLVSLDPNGLVEYSGETGRFPPTLILPPFDPNELGAMQEEIFGPLLPVMEFDSVEGVVTFINERPRPLAFYAFTNDKHVKKTVLNRIVAGGVTINSIALHSTIPALPFGGVGPSGMGCLHGKWGFRTFSHVKAVYDLKRFLLPPLAHPLLKKDIDSMMGLLRFKLGTYLRRSCSVVGLIALGSVAYYLWQNYDISITRKI